MCSHNIFMFLIHAENIFRQFFSFPKLLCILVVYLKIAVQSDDPMLTRVVSLHGGSVDLHIASSAFNLELEILWFWFVSESEVTHFIMQRKHATMDNVFGVLGWVFGDGVFDWNIGIVVDNINAL